MTIRYTCAKYPQLGVGPCQFNDGVFETDDPELQKLIESSFFAAHFKIELIQPAQVEVKQRKKGGRKAPRSFPAGGEA